MSNPDTTPAHVRQRGFKRFLRLTELGYRNYDAYLNSPTWAKVKQAYRESDLPQACICGEADIDLHHKTYERVGEEHLADLMPLCRRCHAALHALERRRDIGLDGEGLQDPERAEQNRAQELKQLIRIIEEMKAERVRRRETFKTLTLSEKVAHIERHAETKAFFTQHRDTLRLIERSLLRLYDAQVKTPSNEIKAPTGTLGRFPKVDILAEAIA